MVNIVNVKVSDGGTKEMQLSRGKAHTVKYVCKIHLNVCFHRDYLETEAVSVTYKQNKYETGNNFRNISKKGEGWIKKKRAASKKNYKFIWDRMTRFFVVPNVSKPICQRKGKNVFLELPQTQLIIKLWLFVLDYCDLTHQPQHVCTFITVILSVIKWGVCDNSSSFFPDSLLEGLQA